VKKTEGRVPRWGWLWYRTVLRRGGVKLRVFKSPSKASESSEKSESSGRTVRTDSRASKGKKGERVLETMRKVKESGNHNKLGAEWRLKTMIVEREGETAGLETRGKTGAT